MNTFTPIVNYCNMQNYNRKNSRTVLYWKIHIVKYKEEMRPCLLKMSDDNFIIFMKLLYLAT